MIRIDDPWKQLRSECFGNVEPEVVLEAVTVPLDNLNKPSDSRDFWDPIETMPAWSAAISYGSREKMAHDLDRRKSLNRKLIDLGHLTPIE
ncbi:MAG: FAD-dependent thymidylate synthase, partial [Thermodesulfobacteriota bacterium]|nr:FAD-dependent thymidylate synthase [Thermodesulfobacteriota bacterium]